ncbi:MAG: histidine phosphatase family protein [Spirochaetales bacterium]|nr:histidine phosphatase family protein [Spirochaetales bacterium]
MIELIFIRHGQTDWNLEKRLQGIQDIPLNQTGREEAERLTSSFNISVNSITSSPLSRAYETAEILNKKLGLNIYSDRRLVERDFGELSGKSVDYSKTVNRDLFGVESIHSMESKISSFLKDMEKLTQGTHIVVTHGGVINILLNMLSEGELNWENTPIHNCSLTSIIFDSSWNINYYGSKEFMLTEEIFIV